MSIGWNASDWDHYWTTERLPQELVAAQRRWVGRIIRFGKLKSLDMGAVADVGCGPAIALFELAKKLPQTSFSGYDRSTAVIRKNRDRVCKLGLPNLEFDAICLPEVPKLYRFDFVLCIATLHYVDKNLKAIRNLYGILNAGGVLVFNYPNRYTMLWYVRNADEVMKRRFALLLSGKNVLTQRRIVEVLGTPCQNFWREVGEATHRANPCLYARA